MGSYLRFSCRNMFYGIFCSTSNIRMKYADIIPHWYEVKGTYLLINELCEPMGHYKPIGNQIHRELLRRAEKDDKELQERNIRIEHKKWEKKRELGLK